MFVACREMSIRRAACHPTSRGEIIMNMALRTNWQKQQQETHKNVRQWLADQSTESDCNPVRPTRKRKQTERGREYNLCLQKNATRRCTATRTDRVFEHSGSPASLTLSALPAASSATSAVDTPCSSQLMCSDVPPAASSATSAVDTPCSSQLMCSTSDVLAVSSATSAVEHISSLEHSVSTAEVACEHMDSSEHSASPATSHVDVLWVNQPSEAKCSGEVEDRHGMDGLSDLSFSDDSLIDSDYVPDSADESATEYSYDEEIVHLAKDINMKHGQQAVHFGSSGAVKSVGSASTGGYSRRMQDVEKLIMSDAVRLGHKNTMNSSVSPSLRSVCSNSLEELPMLIDEMSQEIPLMVHVAKHTESPVTHCENVPATANASRGSDRPSRPCPFCGKFKVRLTRHIRAVHKNEEQVKQVNKGSNEQRAAFKQFKRNGILNYNVKIAGEKDAKLLRERMSKKDSTIVVCDKCSGIFNRHWFSSHKQNCQAEGDSYPNSVATSVFFSSCDVSEEFKKEILSKFTSDEVGMLCQQDETIVKIGCKLYRKLKSRQDKKVEVRRSVMTDMRRLGHVFIHFRDEVEKRNLGSVTVPDMFKPEHLDALDEACTNYTTSKDNGGKEKSGLQIAVYYLLTKAAKTLKVFYLIKREKAKASETGEFLDLFRESKDNFIGGAIYNTNKNRNTQLRRVDNLPQIEDLRKLRNYMSTRITEMTSDEYMHWTSSEFVELRDLACARTTLFNARRGGEPARLSISHWTDACNEVWFDRNRIAAMPAEDQEYFNNTRIMYQTGKGVNHLVPVIVPEDTIPALTKLADPDFRQECGVNANNSYLFPSTVSSESNASGWHALNRACIAAGIEPNKVTATKMRHYASTMFASLEVPEAKRAAFYSHMGHSRSVNESIYQVPLAEQEVREVGTVLRRFGKLNFFMLCSEVHTFCYLACRWLHMLLRQ